MAGSPPTRRIVAAAAVRPCSGTPFTNITNTAISGGTGATSVAYRLFCRHGPSATPNTSQITDWGQLTNLSAANNGGTAEPVGDGAPIGVPIRITAINSGSGTVSAFYNFAQSGIGSPAVSADCGGGSGTVSSSDVNVNAASGPDPEADQGPAGTSFVQNPEVSVESDANQIGDFANANWPSDPADEAVDIATSLYSMSYGVFGVNAHASVASIESGKIPAGDPGTFTAQILQANGVAASDARERSNAYPMSRTLFNIYRTDTVRASTAGFLDWLCDSNSSIQKGTDQIGRSNYDNDLTNVINGQYGYSRLTDATPELAINAQTPADNVPGGGVNGSCDANLQITPGGINATSTTVTLTSAAPSTVQVGWTVEIPDGSSIALPTTSTTYPDDTLDTVAAVSGDTITLTSPAVAGTGATAPAAIYFPGEAPVLAVAKPDS
jgi:hypothetical protein